MPRFVLSSFYVFVFFVAAFGQNDGEYKVLRSQVDDRNFATVVASLKSLRERDRRYFDANNYDYLLARSLEESGATSEAAATYLSIAKRGTVLKEYALWHLAAISRATGNLLLERTYLNEIASFSPDSLLAAAVKQRLVRSFAESENYDQVIKLLVSPTAASTATLPAATARPIRQNLVFLADAFLRTSETAKARDIYQKLVAELANPAQPDDFALAAARGLDQLDRQAGTSAPKPSEYDELQRANIYQFNRDFAGARQHYAAIIANYPASGLVPDAIFQTGRGYALDGNYTEALVWYERVVEQYADHPVAKDALLQAASVYARLGKRREAVARYQHYISKYPDDERIDRAYLNIIDVYRDGREESDALKWAGETRAKFSGKLPEALALFAEARIRLSNGDLPGALADLDTLLTLPDLGGPATPGGTSKSEITFLRGYVLEQLGRFPEAVEAYLSVPDGRTEYYGWRANERLSALGKDERGKQAVSSKLASLLTAKQSGDPESQRRAIQSAIRLTADGEIRKGLLEDLRKIYAQLPMYKNPFNFRFIELGRKQPRSAAEKSDSTGTHQQIADELLFLGLYDEAAPELEAARKPVTIAQKTDFDYTLAVFYKRGDRGDKASAFVEPIWKVPADYQTEMIPRAVTELLYPTPYAEPLLKYAPPRNVDPRLVLSVMRQESRFRPDVKSNAAARGLMQFISSTSERVAAEVGKKNFRQDDLYDPATSVLFGSQYLADLFTSFPNQPQAVAASYNGGDDNMKRWLARSKSNDPDVYVPEVVFAQSKDYVYKVMSNYRMYRILYDETLKPLSR